MVRYCVLAVAGMACYTAAAYANPPGVNPVGVWKVVDYTATDPKTGQVEHPFGMKPIGSAVYSAKGHVSVFVTGADRKPSKGAGIQRAEERSALFDTMYAYTGTYTVKDDKVTLHIESAWQPDWVGTDKVRTLRLDRDVLTITTEPMTSPVDGKTYISTTTFRRVE